MALGPDGLPSLAIKPRPDIEFWLGLMQVEYSMSYEWCDKGDRTHRCHLIDIPDVEHALLFKLTWM